MPLLAHTHEYVSWRNESAGDRESAEGKENRMEMQTIILSITYCGAAANQHYSLKCKHNHF